MLLPDQVQPKVYAEESSRTSSRAPRSSSRTASTSTTGGSSRRPGHDVIMVAPKGPGHVVRRIFTEGYGTPGARSPSPQDASGNARELALAYGDGHRRRPRRDARDDVHRGDRDRPLRRAGRALRRRHRADPAGFETLVEAGYQPEIAYYECLHELKLIVDLIYEGGFAGMRYSISDTAEYGDLTRGPRVIDDARAREHARRSSPRSARARSRRSGSRRWTRASRTSTSCAQKAARASGSRTSVTRLRGLDGTAEEASGVS